MRSELGGQIVRTVELTEETDGNDLLGRPGGYTSAVVLHDSTVESCGDPGVECGAVVEVWPSEGKADDRMEYLQALRNGTSILGTEYDYVHGGVLLRVDGALPPSLAQKYEDAFDKAAG